MLRRVAESKLLLGVVVMLTYLASSERSALCDYYYHPYSHAQATPIVSLTLDPQEGLNCDLRIAAREDKLDQLLHLIRQGAKVNGVSDSGQTALMYAAQTCHVQIGKALLSNGAQLNPRDKYGRTALMYASMGSCAPMIFLMTSYSGLNLRVRDNSGHTALGYARDSASLYEEGPPIESVRLLQKALKRSGLRTRKIISSLHSQHSHISDFDKKS